MGEDRIGKTEDRVQRDYMYRRIVNKARQVGIYSLLRYGVKSMGLGPQQVLGRFTGPIIVLNSLPKAGTHLIRRMIEAMPTMRPCYPTIYSGGAKQILLAYRRLMKLRPGQYVSTHMPFNDEFAELIEKRGIRHVILIRDPRDVVLSFMRYVTYKDKTHRLHEYMAALSDDDERLMHCIQGVDVVISGDHLYLHDVAEDFERYSRWADQPGTLALRFEDLIGPKGGGSLASQTRSVRALIDFAGFTLSDEEVLTLANGSFGRGSTFNKGRIGSWCTAFKPEHKTAFKRLANHHLIRWGYESNEDW